MGEFIEFTLPDYTLSNDFEPVVFDTTGICVCCMVKSSTFVNLLNCKHTGFLENFLEIKSWSPSMIVCQLCHSILKKITNFKQQVEESFILLSQKTKDLKTCNKVINLKYSKLDVYSNLEVEPHEDTIELVKRESTNQEPEFETTTEIKVEHETFSDFENEVPLSEIKKEMKKSKEKTKKDKGKGKKKKVQRPIDAKYEGKIRIVTLSPEELQAERAAERAGAAYLRLPHRCAGCVAGFDHEDTLRDHLDKRHAPKAGGFTCDICTSVLSTENSYKEHCKRHYRRYECIACGRRNNTLQAIVQHYKSAHGHIATAYTCDQCGFTTDSNRKYRYHRDKHKDKPHCPDCGNAFVNNTALKIHMFTVHKRSSRVYSCGSCARTYAAKSGLAAHRQRCHAPAGLHYCAPCQQQFRCAASLRHHQRTHSKHRSEASHRFACDECPARFVSRAALREHAAWLHRAGPAHRCQRCDKVFKNARYLQRHTDFVHDKKRLPRDKICDHCGRAFTTLSILRAHIRTHTGERPLRCARCPAAFAHSAALYTHNKLLHAQPGRG